MGEGALGVSQTCDLEQRVAGVPAIESARTRAQAGGRVLTQSIKFCALNSTLIFPCVCIRSRSDNEDVDANVQQLAHRPGEWWLRIGPLIIEEGE